MTLGLGRAPWSRSRSTTTTEMDAEALARRSTTDHRAGRRPVASSRRSARRPRRPPTRSRAIADVADAAKACGCTWTRRTPASSRCIPERRAPFAGWDRADSIVVNPHKWLFTPLDASLLLTPPHGPALRAAFSLVPEYLRTLDRASPGRSTTTSTSRSSAAGCGR